MLLLSDYIESMFLGVGLSMDAASVSMTDGMIESKMKKKKMLFIAFLFGLFQGLMPFIGYLFAHIFENTIAKYIPYIGFGLLAFLGIKMLIDGFKNKDEKNDTKVTFSGIIVQAFATSIDALTTGIIYADRVWTDALQIFLVVALVTFSISFIAIILGKKFGEFFSNYASILGGIILFSIGFKILSSVSDILQIIFYVYLLLLVIALLVIGIILLIKHKKHKALLFDALLNEIKKYQPNTSKEESDKEIFINHLNEYKYKLFSRKNEKCHITSSAFVFNKNMDKVLLCYHNIYDSWSWLGGHADKRIDLLNVAIKEIEEETGSTDFEVLFNNEIISLEILPVKEHVKNNKPVKEHFHFNITYAFISLKDEENMRFKEKVKYVPFDELDKIVSEKHMLEIYKKIINVTSKIK